MYHAVERAVGRQTGMLGPMHAGMAFLPNLLRAFSYFPHNRAAQPSLFLFHGVALMALSPLCRLAALRFYVAYRKSRLAQRLPDRLARAAGCVAASVLFSVLGLLTSFPAMVLLRLVPLAEVGERLNDCCGGVVVAVQGSS